MTIAPEEQQSIRYALRDCKWEALSIFMGDFMQLLTDEGFSLEDLLHVLATYSDSQVAYKEATHHLEKAALAIRTPSIDQ
jgi:hypothetical protein